MLEYKSDFAFFLETLVRDCCAGREPEVIKKISNTLTVLANEKQKLNKADKNKGKKKAAATTKKTLASGKAVQKADDDYYDDYYNEYDDFMKGLPVLTWISRRAMTLPVRCVGGVQ